MSAGQEPSAFYNERETFVAPSKEEQKFKTTAILSPEKNLSETYPDKPSINPSPIQETLHLVPNNPGNIPEKTHKKIKIFDFFFSLKDKTLPELSGNLFQKYFKAIGGVIDFFKKPKQFQVSRDVLQVFEHGFALVNAVFDWTRAVRKIKEEIQTILKQKKENRNYVDLVLQFAKLPFLFMQNLLSVSELVVIWNAGLKDFLKQNKSLKWFFTGISYLGGHIISPIQNLKKLYDNRSKTGKKAEDERSQTLKDLIKDALVLIVSAGVVVIAWLAFRDLSAMETARSVALSLMTFIDSIFKYFPQFFKAIGDFGLYAWQRISKSAQKEVNIEKNVEKEISDLKLQTSQKSQEGFINMLKRFGAKFRQYHEEKQIKTSLLEGKITFKKAATFSVNALLVVGGFLGTATELLGSDLALVSGGVLPALFVISTVIFAFSAILFVDNLIKYVKGDEKNTSQELADKMIMQGAKMVLTALFMGLCAWAFFAAFPLLGVTLVAGVAVTLFYGYVALNRHFSEKKVLYKNFELKNEKPEESHVKENKTTVCLYLELKGEAAPKEVISYALNCKGEVKYGSFDPDKLGDEKYAAIVAALRAGEKLTPKQERALFDELSGAGYHQFGKTGKATWPGMLRNLFWSGVSLLAETLEKVVSFSKNSEKRDSVPEAIKWEKTAPGNMERCRDTDIKISHHRDNNSPGSQACSHSLIMGSIGEEKNKIKSEEIVITPLSSLSTNDKLDESVKKLEMAWRIHLENMRPVVDETMKVSQHPSGIFSQSRSSCGVELNTCSNDSLNGNNDPFYKLEVNVY